MDYKSLTKKKQRLDAFRPLPPALLRNLADWFRVELTYTSNALEGNTLTRSETAIVLEKGITVGGKSLREHLEVRNHAQALEFVQGLIERKTIHISLAEILAIHEIILRGIDDEHAGRFRNISVRISGSSVVLPNAQKVPQLMEEFQKWLKSAQNLHPVAFAGEAHYRFVSIHPFIDGNGRSARLLMNLLLMMAGYPPAIIRKRDRSAYLAALEKAQLGGSRDDFDKLIEKAVSRSLDIYLKAARGEDPDEDLDNDKLLKIGELAKATQLTVATVRFWTKEGLLEVAEVSESGYQRYAPDMVLRCRRIQEMKKKRMTLAEIKKELSDEEGSVL